ncbi:hypothetical protein [Streptomyces sp. NPDC019890]|uniref:hypothetical protein n=1 Tax=Streptomyces sp. NPDC019890 TaxID=3365064 RepID=UPI00384F4CD6
MTALRIDPEGTVEPVELPDGAAGQQDTLRSAVVPAQSTNGGTAGGSYSTFTATGAAE